MAAADTMMARNPRTGLQDYTFERADAEAVAAAAISARAAQPDWVATSPAGRAAVLRQWAAALEARREAVIKALVADTGRYHESVLELDSTIAALLRWADRGESLSASAGVQTSGVPGIDMQLAGKPYPLAGVISPWNFPLLLALLDAIPALMAGTAVLVKPSEITPRFIEPLRNSLAGIEPLSEVLQFLPGDGSTGTRLLGEVDMVVFTGSVATGRRVGQMAAERLIPAFLELGGKDPAIVTADADIERTAAALVWGSMANAGQSCLSIERVYVHRSRHEQLLEALAGQLASLRLNTGTPEQGEIGPVIAERQVRTLRAHLRDAVDKGAQVLCGGELVSHGGGIWCQPTLLSDVRQDMLVMCAETFGPILPVMPFDTEQEAVALANDSEFGLSAAVFSGSTGQAQEIASKLEAGAISINDCALTAIIYEGEKQSFKLSGLGGSRMGPASQQRFLRRQAYLINRQQSWNPWWFRQKIQGMSSS